MTSPLEAITAALAAKNGAAQQTPPFAPRPNPGAPAPFAANVTFQAGAGGTGQGGGGNGQPGGNPFNPQAAFVAAVPQAAQTHAHPTTGVPFAPINPPGEATPVALNGLDATPLAGRTDFAGSGQADVHDTNGTVVGPHGTPQPLDHAPKGRRGRKPKADALDLGTESTAGAGAAQPAAVSAAPGSDDWLRELIQALQAGVPAGVTVTLTIPGKA